MKKDKSKSAVSGGDVTTAQSEKKSTGSVPRISKQKRTVA